MPRPRINGTLAPVQQAAEIEFDPSRGQVIRIPWESAGDNLAAIASAYAALRVPYSLVASGHKSRLVASASASQLGYPEVITDTWQILGNEIQKDVWEHPAALAMDAIYPNDSAYIKEAVNLYTAGNTGSDLTAVFKKIALANTLAPELFKLLRKGTTHYALGQYVLRHTTNVSNAYSANVADLHVEQVYTTAQLLGEVVDSSLWSFPLPGRLQYKLNNLPAPGAVAGYLWGWRKVPSTETTTGTNRVEISTEYWLEQWNTSVLYTPFS